MLMAKGGGVPQCRVAKWKDPEAIVAGREGGHHDAPAPHSTVPVRDSVQHARRGWGAQDAPRRTCSHTVCAPFWLCGSSSGWWLMTLAEMRW